jgi:hypothetical protein
MADKLVPVGEYAGKEYEPEDLFPQFYSKRSRNERRNYVREVMQDLAETGQLFLTDILARNDDVRDMAGQVIIGEFVDDEGNVHHDGSDVPEAVRDFGVTVKQIGEYPIVVKRGMKVKGYKKGGKAKYAGVGAQDGGCPLYTDDLVAPEVQSGEAVLPIRDAWLLLRQYGKDCCFPRAKGQSRKKQWWRYQEIRPAPARDDGAPVSDEPPRRRGRPPKRSQEAVG